MTDMAMGVFKPFAQDPPTLMGVFELGSRMRKHNSLSRKYTRTNWSVDELVERKDEILSQGKLSIVVKDDFREEQFK